MSWRFYQNEILSQFTHEASNRELQTEVCQGVFYELIYCVYRDKTCVKKEILKMNEPKNLPRNIVPDFFLITTEPDSADCLSYCQSTPALEGERVL